MDNLSAVAGWLRERNAIDAMIAPVINRPMTSGHLGEWLAEQIFAITLEKSAATAGWDGRFTGGELAGRTVNVKWYLKREGPLDLVQRNPPDFYLVFTGPASAAVSSRGGIRPWCITHAYLFDAGQLTEQLRQRGVKIGIASSLLKAQWGAAEIYPAAGNPALPMSAEQRRQLALFAPAT